MLLLHVSDTHLGASKPSKLREREVDFYEAFNEVVEIAIREHVDAVIHAGDFFDEPRPTPQAYLYAYRTLRKLREHGIDFLVIAGQHDQPRTSQLPPLRVLSEMGLLKLLAQDHPETHIVKIRGEELGVVAIPYISPVKIEEYLKSIKVPGTSRRILVAHLLLKELNIPSAHASLAELGADKYNYVALGDYHLRYETEYRGVPVAYTGSTEALDILEALSDKYTALVDLSSGEVRVNWVKLSSPRKWIRIEARNYKEFFDSISKIALEKYSKPPILYVTLKGKQSDLEVRRVRDHVNKLISERRILIGRVEVEEEVSGVVTRSVLFEGASSSASTLDQVVYSVLGDREIAEVVLALLRSSESREDVKLIVNRILEDERLVNKIRRLVSTR